MFSSADQRSHDCQPANLLVISHVLRSASRVAHINLSCQCWMYLRLHCHSQPVTWQGCVSAWWCCDHWAGTSNCLPACLPVCMHTHTHACLFLQVIARSCLTRFSYMRPPSEANHLNTAYAITLWDVASVHTNTEKCPRRSYATWVLSTQSTKITFCYCQWKHPEI